MRKKVIFFLGLNFTLISAGCDFFSKSIYVSGQPTGIIQNVNLSKYFGDTAISIARAVVKDNFDNATLLIKDANNSLQDIQAKGYLQSSSPLVLAAAQKVVDEINDAEKKLNVIKANETSVNYKNVSATEAVQFQNESNDAIQDLSKHIVQAQLQASMADILVKNGGGSGANGGGGTGSNSANGGNNSGSNSANGGGNNNPTLVVAQAATTAASDLTKKYSDQAENLITSEILSLKNSSDPNVVAAVTAAENAKNDAVNAKKTAEAAKANAATKTVAGDAQSEQKKAETATTLALAKLIEAQSKVTEAVTAQRVGIEATLKQNVQKATDEIQNIRNGITSLTNYKTALDNDPNASATAKTTAANNLTNANTALQAALAAQTKISDALTAFGTATTPSERETQLTASTNAKSTLETQASTVKGFVSSIPATTTTTNNANTSGAGSNPGTSGAGSNPNTPSSPQRQYIEGFLKTASITLVNGKIADVVMPEQTADTKKAEDFSNTKISDYITAHPNITADKTLLDELMNLPGVSAINDLNNAYSEIGYFVRKVYRGETLTPADEARIDAAKNSISHQLDLVAQGEKALVTFTQQHP